MAKFWELFKDSIVTQSVITVIVVGTVSVAVLTGKQLPGEYWALAMGVCGFWFGQKGVYTANRAARAAIQELLGKEE